MPNTLSLIYNLFTLIVLLVLTFSVFLTAFNENMIANVDIVVEPLLA